ncbi:MAG: thimet oligopeptidase [Patescibacteria group bacterium]|nr:thimet oligopeptidase [Patescibacteria group bacterium]
MKNETSQILPNWKEISKVLKYKKQDFDKLLEAFLKHKKEIYTEVKKIKKEDRTFQNTFLAIEKSGDDFADRFYQISTFAMTHKDKDFRDLANNFQKESAYKMVDMEHDKDIYRAIVEYKEGNYKKEKLGLDKKYGVGSVKLFEDSYKAYKRMGFDLPSVKQEKLKKNSKELSRLSLDFERNINDYKDFILCSEEEIKGLPENFVKSLEKVKGKYKITLDYPSIGPFLQYADSREKRKELVDKNAKKGGEKNLKILAEMINLRDNNAKLLGYKNHAEFKLENKMAKTEKAVRRFLSDAMKQLKPISLKQRQELNNFAKANLEDYKDINNLEYFDTSYVQEKLKHKKYSYDSAKIKEYFELDHVLKEMFSIFGELFNFSAIVIDEKQKKEKGITLQDKDVKLVELKDKKTKQIVSYLVLDLFPRDGKYGHACSAEFILSRFIGKERVVPINEIICNFQKPNKNMPSLLSLREVETLFHEFGHAIHYMLTNCVYSAQACTNVVRDFVETPSQFMENFLYEEKNLKKIAVHYKTKKFLDKEIIHKIIESKNFMAADMYYYIFVSSLFDIEMHSNQVPLNNNGLDITKYYSGFRKKYTEMEGSKFSLFPAAWGHMAGGYDAGYYSYMWALVYAQDFYSEFKKVENNKNKLKEIGERYRREILEVGGSRDEMTSVKKFLGRNGNDKAFLKEIGAK